MMTKKIGSTPPPMKSKICDTVRPSWTDARPLAGTGAVGVDGAVVARSTAPAGAVRRSGRRRRRR